MTQLTDAEAFDFLKSLFPGGLKDSALISELCPDGWEESPLFACYHPPLEVIYQEHIEFSRNIKRLFPRSKRQKEQGEPVPPDEPEPTFEEFLAKHPPKDKPLSPEAQINEPADLLGRCLWDVFSSNHDVLAADGRIVHLGSFRGSAGTIADFMTAFPRPGDDAKSRSRRDAYDYLDFYMGSIWINQRADLTPAYRLIFQRLQSQGADWAYAFPQLHIIDFGSAQAASDSYDPSAAIQREAEQKARAAETAKLRRQIARAAKSAKRRGRTGPPPSIVRAYQQIYDRFPQGWPPDPYQPD
jgi:hypothetical protein